MTDKPNQTEVCQRLALAVQAMGQMPEDWDPPQLIAGVHPKRPGNFPDYVTNEYTHGMPWLEAERDFYDHGNEESLLENLKRTHAGQPESPEVTAKEIVARGAIREQIYLSREAWGTNRELWRRAWWAALAYQHVLRVWNGVLGPQEAAQEQETTPTPPPANPEAPAGQEAE